MPNKNKYYGPVYEATRNYKGPLVVGTGGQRLKDWSTSERLSPSEIGNYHRRGRTGVGGRFGRRGAVGVRKRRQVPRMVSTPLGTFEAENWGHEALLDLAGVQRDEMLGHAGRLGGIAEKVAGRATMGFDESGTEVPGLISLLSSYLSGDKSITELPDFGMNADYIERAVRRGNAALGYNMSGNVANAVAQNLAQFAMRERGSEIERIIDALGMHQRSANLFPSEIYADLLAQGSLARAQQYDPFGSAIGYISGIANERV